MGWADLYAVAGAQHHGAFALRDAPNVGLTVKAVAARVRRDPWPRPYPGVVFVPGFRVDHRSHIAAAQLYLGESAAASDLSAAWLYDLVSQPPIRPHLLLPHERRVETMRAVIRRSRKVEPADRACIDGLSVVTPVFLLIAISPRTMIDALCGFALNLRQRGMLDPTALAERLDAAGRVPGRDKVKRVLANLLRDGSDSMFESLVRDRLRAAGFEPSAAPVPVTLSDGRTVHLDIAFAAQRVAVECQGFVAHHSWRQLDRDARRDNGIALSGDWLVLKLTWHRFQNDWSGFMRELETALRGRS